VRQHPRAVGDEGRAVHADAAAAFHAGVRERLGGRERRAGRGGGSRFGGAPGVLDAREQVARRGPRRGDAVAGLARVRPRVARRRLGERLRHRERTRRADGRRAAHHHLPDRPRGVAMRAALSDGELEGKEVLVDQAHHAVVHPDGAIRSAVDAHGRKGAGNAERMARKVARPRSERNVPGDGDSPGAASAG